LVAIVLNYNGLRFLEECFDSLFKQTYDNMEVVMVDNGSSDGSVEFVNQRFPEVHVLRNERNLGYSEGNNLGIRYAAGRSAALVLILNNDVSVERKAVEKMVKVATSREQVGIVGPLIRDLEDRNNVQELGLDCDILAFPVPSSRKFRPGIVSPFYVSGCAMLIKREVLVEVGLFDPSYFMLAEDLDLCWRARLAGYQVVATSDATIYHKSGGTLIGGIARGRIHKTTVSRLYYSRRNSFQTLVKNYGSLALAIMLPSTVAFYVVSLIASELLGQIDVSRAYILAMIWNVRNMPSTLQRRMLVQSMRKVSDRAIIKKLDWKSGLVRAYRSAGRLEVVRQPK